MNANSCHECQCRKISAEPLVVCQTQTFFFCIFFEVQSFLKTFFRRDSDLRPFSFAFSLKFVQVSLNFFSKRLQESSRELKTQEALRDSSNSRDSRHYFKTQDSRLKTQETQDSRDYFTSILERSPESGRLSCCKR